MRYPIIAGNWKMNGLSHEAECLLEGISGVQRGKADLIVFPPFTALGQARRILEQTWIQWGAQNVYPASSGAYTGEISPLMVKELGCTWCLCGHSERRRILGETDEFISRKVRALLDVKIKPILCVGETREERLNGQTACVVQREVEKGLSAVTAEEALQVVIAYEPVWAIGAGQAATTEEAGEVCGWIRECVNRMFGTNVSEAVRILYGGSVGKENIADFLRVPHIDGALIGGASLSADEFSAIYNMVKA